MNTVTKCPTCSRYARAITGEVDECRESGNQDERRCLYFQMRIADPTRFVPDDSGLETIVMPKGAQVVLLMEKLQEQELLIDRLKKQLEEEGAGHLEARGQAASHASLAERLRSDIATLQRKLQDFHAADPGDTSAGSAAEVDIKADVRQTLVNRFVTFVKALPASTHFRTGGIASMLGIVLGAGGLHIYQGTPAPLAPASAAVAAAAPASQAARGTQAASTSPAASLASVSAGVADESVAGSRGSTASASLDRPPASAAPHKVPERRDTLPRHPDRIAISEALKAKLAAAGLEAINFDLSKSGKVTLSGAVPTQVDKDRALSLTLSQAGVSQVVEFITVQASLRDLEKECKDGTSMWNRPAKVFSCMRAKCRTPELQSHPQCTKFCEAGGVC